MKRFLVGAALCWFGGQAFAQVDVEHRRTLTLQSGTSIYQSEEALDGYGYFWFNEDHFPWDRTALRNGDRGGHEVALALEKQF